MKKILSLLSILIIITSCNEVSDLKPLDRLSEKIYGKMRILSGIYKR